MHWPAENKNDCCCYAQIRRKINPLAAKKRITLTIHTFAEWLETLFYGHSEGDRIHCEQRREERNVEMPTRFQWVNTKIV